MQNRAMQLKFIFVGAVLGGAASQYVMSCEPKVSYWLSSARQRTVQTSLQNPRAIPPLNIYCATNEGRYTPLCYDIDKVNFECFKHFFSYPNSNVCFAFGVVMGAYIGLMIASLVEKINKYRVHVNVEKSVEPQAKTTVDSVVISQSIDSVFSNKQSSVAKIIADIAVNYRIKMSTKQASYKEHNKNKQLLIRKIQNDLVKLHGEELLTLSAIEQITLAKLIAGEINLVASVNRKACLMHLDSDRYHSVFLQAAFEKYKSKDTMDALEKLDELRLSGDAELIYPVDSLFAEPSAPPLTPPRAVSPSSSPLVKRAIQ